MSSPAVHWQGGGGWCQRVPTVSGRQNLSPELHRLCALLAWILLCCLKRKSVFWVWSCCCWPGYYCAVSNVCQFWVKKKKVVDVSLNTTVLSQMCFSFCFLSCCWILMCHLKCTWDFCLSCWCWPRYWCTLIFFYCCCSGGGCHCCWCYCCCCLLVLKRFWPAAGQNCISQKRALPSVMRVCICLVCQT